MHSHAPKLVDLTREAESGTKRNAMNDERMATDGHNSLVVRQLVWLSLQSVPANRFERDVYRNVKVDTRAGAQSQVIRSSTYCRISILSVCWKKR